MDEILINISSSIENVNIVVNEFRGRSAYQVWLDAGNTGTENDFFISIGQIGASGSFEAQGSGILSGSVLNYVPIIVSGSSQIDVLGTQNFTTISSSIDLRLDTLEGFSSSLNTTFVTDTELQLTASAIENKINVTASLFNTFSSSINTTIKTKLDTDGVISGSSQVQLNNVSGFTVYSASVNDTINQINISSQSANLRIDALEIESASVRSRLLNIEITTESLNTFSSSINTAIKEKLNGEGVVSGSSQIQLSGITGTTFANSNFTFPQDLAVQGKLTAQEFFTEYITSSVILESGSTKFGDSLDDTHKFTGSVFMTGSLEVNGQMNVGRSIIIEPTHILYTNFIEQNGTNLGISYYAEGSGHRFTGSVSITGSLTLNGQPIESGRLDETEFYLFTSSYNAYTESINSQLTNLEFESGSIRNDFNNYTSSTDFRLLNIEATTESLNEFSSSINDTIKVKLNTESVISGSSQLTTSYDGRYELQGRAILSGSVLNYIPVIVSQSSQIELNNISGSTFANTNFTFPQDLVVQGKLTAQEFHTELISSSIIYESGSTKFGDTLDDTHQFTGSVYISGSISLNGQPIGTGKLDEVVFNQYTQSNDLRVQSLEIESASIRNQFNSFTQSINIEQTTQNDRLNSLETESGSIRTTLNQYTSSTNLRLDSLEIESGSIRSEFNSYTQSTDIRLNSIELFTSSIDSTIKTKLDADGVISGSSQLTSSYDQRYILSGSITETTWDNIENKPTGIVSGSSQLTASYDIRYELQGINILSGSVLNYIPVIVSSSSQLTGSYDTRYETQGRSLLSGSVLNYIPVIVSGSSQINFTQLSGISANIISSSTDTQNVDVIVTGGSISANLKGGVVSGSSQIDVIGTQNYSTLATTGSNTFNGNQIISGSLEVDIDTIILSGSMYVSGTIEVIAITGSLSGIAETASYVEYQNVVNKPTLVSGSSQLTSSYDQRYIISGTITQTTWDNIANKPDGIVSGSSQINIYDTTNYVNFSSSLSDTNVTQSLRLTDIELFTQSIDSRVDNIEITTASINLRLDSLEVESGSIRTTFNQFTASYNTGSFTGSFIGDLIGTSSYALTASYIDGGFY